jgi:hypothetical protein
MEYSTVFDKCSSPVNWVEPENCGEKAIKAPKGLYLIDILAAQNIPHHKPPKILMSKQIKHLVSSSSF